MISKLVLFLFVLPRKNHGFVPHSSYKYKCWLDRAHRFAKNDPNPIVIDDVMNEVEMALREADNALNCNGNGSDSSTNTNSNRGIEPASSPGGTNVEDSNSKATKPTSLAPLQDVVPTFLGGLMIGTILGLAFDYTVSDSTEFGFFNPMVPPLMSASGFAIGGSSLVLAGGPVGKITASVLGGPIIAAVTALTDSAKRKVQQTKQEIREFPSKLASSAKDRVMETKQEIREFPSKVVSSAKEKAIETGNKAKQKVIKSIDDTTETFTSLPRNTLEALKSGDVNKLTPLLVLSIVAAGGVALVVALSDARL